MADPGQVQLGSLSSERSPECFSPSPLLEEGPEAQVVNETTYPPTTILAQCNFCVT